MSEMIRLELCRGAALGMNKRKEQHGAVLFVFLPFVQVQSCAVAKFKMNLNQLAQFAVLSEMKQKIIIYVFLKIYRDREATEKGIKQLD